MLIGIDERVLASVNLHAVFGALPRLAEVAPEARALLATLRRPVTLTHRIARGDGLRLVFHHDRIVADSTPTGVRASLHYLSPSHLNRVVAGKAQPLPVAGPAGLRFLTRVFVPLTALLERYLTAGDAEISDLSRLMLLDVAANAIVVVANEDRSGRFSAQQMSDGDLDIAVGSQLRYRIRVRDHRLTRVPAAGTPARATFGFADLRTAGDVLAGKESALACVGDGRIALSGYIPLVDNTSRILDRVGHYLGK